MGLEGLDDDECSKKKITLGKTGTNVFSFVSWDDPAND